jgi:hypothetical protein
MVLTPDEEWATDVEQEPQIGNVHRTACDHLKNKMTLLVKQKPKIT